MSVLSSLLVSAAPKWPTQASSCRFKSVCHCFVTFSSFSTFFCSVNRFILFSLRQTNFSAASIFICSDLYPPCVRVWKKECVCVDNSAPLIISHNYVPTEEMGGRYQKETIDMVISVTHTHTHTRRGLLQCDSRRIEGFIFCLTNLLFPQQTEPTH